MAQVTIICIQSCDCVVNHNCILFEFRLIELCTQYVSLEKVQSYV